MSISAVTSDKRIVLEFLKERYCLLSANVLIQLNFNEAFSSDMIVQVFLSLA